MPDYSVIIPAYNEADNLPEMLNCLTAAMNAINDLHGEVIVVDNNSTDRTGDIARNAGVQVVFEEHNQISRARNRGAAAARGHYLIFIDADTLVSSGIMRQALELLETGKIYGGGVKVGFTEEIPWSARLFVSFWNICAGVFKLFAGCFVFCRKEAFDAVGGFREDIYAAEEVYLARGLRKWGRKHSFKFGMVDNEYIKTSPRKLRQYPSWKIIPLLLLLGSLPFLLKSRNMCFFWYNRKP